MRGRLVLIHRLTGLVLALFLIIASVTGTMLVWNDSLEALISPQLFRTKTHHPGAKPLDPFTLRAIVQARYPDATLNFLELGPPEPGLAVSIFIQGPINPKTGLATPAPNDQIFVDPYTGEWLGERKWGDIGQGARNFMPFVFLLHQSLALGKAGRLLLGVVGLLWTIDCFVGAWLTFPQSAKGGPAPSTTRSWFARWRKAWSMRWSGGSHRRNVDLHRAGGLWLWALLLIFAWSSVSFNLRSVYDPVMGAAFHHQKGDPGGKALPRPLNDPPIHFAQARVIGRQLMAEQAQIHQFKIKHEDWLAYFSHRGLYRYDVLSDRDVRSNNGYTTVWFDARTGKLKGTFFPTGEAPGDTVDMWLASIHMAAMGGIPMKLLVTFMGFAVLGLTVTGVLIWWKKRKARVGRKRPPKATPPVYARSGEVHATE